MHISPHVCSSEGCGNVYTHRLICAYTCPCACLVTCVCLYTASLAPVSLSVFLCAWFPIPMPMPSPHTHMSTSACPYMQVHGQLRLASNLCAIDIYAQLVFLQSARKKVSATNVGIGSPLMLIVLAGVFVGQASSGWSLPLTEQHDICRDWHIPLHPK